MTNPIHPVLLCGGSGTRLWPLSRKSYPKQFVKLTGDESLYQASARRLSGGGFAAPSIVTAADFRFIVIEQLAALEIAPADILIDTNGMVIDAKYGKHAGDQWSVDELLHYAKANR